MIRLLTLLLVALAALPALAEEPQVSITLDPAGPVTVGTPLKVEVTLLVPTFMPEPPVWPDLQIADVITRTPDRPTSNVTRRIGQTRWAGIARTWILIPQREADFDLGAQSIAVTYADPQTRVPTEVTMPLPDIAFTAVVPRGAEGLHPFLAATGLTLAMDLTGLTGAPRPGDAITVTLTTRAEGASAMLLPPLAGRLPDQRGLRAYPAQPVLADARDGASRIEKITYMIEQPGHYAIPGITLGWWNSATETVESARAQGVRFDVAVEAVAGQNWPPHLNILAGLVTLLAVGAALLLLRRRKAAPRRAEPAAFRQLRRLIRSAPPGAIRPALAHWLRCRKVPMDARSAAAIEQALLAIERTAYGPGRPGAADKADRQALDQAVRAARSRIAPKMQAALPGLNPAISSSES